MKAKLTATSGIKFAEAAVLFVLILGLTIFVGVRVASHTTGVAQMAAPAVVVPPAAEPVAALPAVVDSVPAKETIAHGDQTPTRPAPEAAAVSTARDETPVSGDTAVAAYTAGHYDEAVDLMTAYTAQHPQYAWGPYFLGMTLWKAGDPEGALDSFQTALGMNPDDMGSLINAGRVLLELNRPEQARQELTKAVALDADNVQALRVLARAQNMSGMAAEAEATYRGLLIRHPDDVWALNNLGLMLIQQERFPEALPAVARAAQLNPGLACVQNNLGIALERSGFVAAAQEAYAKAVALDTAYTRAQTSLKRLAPVVEAQGLAPFDLAATAAAFVPSGTAAGLAPGGSIEVAASGTPATAAEAKPDKIAVKSR